MSADEDSDKNRKPPELPAEFAESQKETAGRFATFAWVLIGAYLFYRHPEARFLSWQAAVYFIGGMFVAAVVFGWLVSGSPRSTFCPLLGDPLKALPRLSFWSGTS